MWVYLFHATFPLELSSVRIGTVLFSFHHCNKIHKINKLSGLYWLTVSETSVSGWLHCFWACGSLWQRKRLTSWHLGGKERGRGWGSDIPFKGMTRVYPAKKVLPPPTEPDNQACNVDLWGTLIQFMAGTMPVF